ncbi:MULTISPECIES: hypothetical protein [Comamonas]|uniref:hypothetical protein n=1 Tax=Comamonas TaxID=283 RepID=UPI0012FEB5AC|nr:MULTISPECIES: hypothetical protein [Comamonas]
MRNMRARGAAFLWPGRWGVHRIASADRMKKSTFLAEGALRYVQPDGGCKDQFFSSFM